MFSVKLLKALAICVCMLFISTHSASAYCAYGARSADECFEPMCMTHNGSSNHGAGSHPISSEDDDDNDDDEDLGPVRSFIALFPWGSASLFLTDTWEACKDSVTTWMSGSTSSYCSSCGQTRLNSHSCSDYYYDGSYGY